MGNPEAGSGGRRLQADAPPVDRAMAGRLPAAEPGLALALAGRSLRARPDHAQRQRPSPRPLPLLAAGKGTTMARRPAPRPLAPRADRLREDVGRARP